MCVCFRGNSKYHYYGLRIKSGSPLLRLMDEQQHMAMRQQPFSQKNRYLHVATQMPCLLNHNMSCVFPLTLSL